MYIPELILTSWPNPLTNRTETCNYSPANLESRVTLSERYIRLFTFLALSIAKICSAISTVFTVLRYKGLKLNLLNKATHGLLWCKKLDLNILRSLSEWSCLFRQRHHSCITVATEPRQPFVVSVGNRPSRQGCELTYNQVTRHIIRTVRIPSRPANQILKNRWMLSQQLSSISYRSTAEDRDGGPTFKTWCTHDLTRHQYCIY